MNKSVAAVVYAIMTELEESMQDTNKYSEVIPLATKLFQECFFMDKSAGPRRWHKQFVDALANEEDFYKKRVQFKVEQFTFNPELPTNVPKFGVQQEDERSKAEYARLLKEKHITMMVDMKNRGEIEPLLEDLKKVKIEFYNQWVQ